MNEPTAKPKGKAPAFQFYVLDYMDDADGLCAASNGIWIRMLCKLHRAKIRGEVTATFDSWCRKCNCTRDELENFFRENDVEEVADVTVSDEIVTVKSRRMIRERKEREGAAKRQREYMSRRSNDGQVTNNDKNLTTLSSSSSSSSYKRREGEASFDPQDPTDRIAASGTLAARAAEIKGWNFSQSEDLEYFGRLLGEFPFALIAKTIEDLHVYQERPAKKYSNLHATLRNWVKREAERNPEPEKCSPNARLDAEGNPLALVDGDWIGRREFDRKLAEGEIVRKGNAWRYAAKKGG